MVEDLTRKVSRLPAVLAHAESSASARFRAPEVDQHLSIPQVDDLAPKAEEALRLKDQMDEYRHASEKAKKQENVIEKYKKKLEEAAETRRMLKVRRRSHPRSTRSSRRAAG